MVQVVKNEMWASEECFACLTWLYGLFVRTLISPTNAYAGCGRPTLNLIEHFWLGSVRSASKLNSKCTQMNYEMNCITICTYMYRNVLQRIGEPWNPEELMLIRVSYISSDIISLILLLGPQAPSHKMQMVCFLSSVVNFRDCAVRPSYVTFEIAQYGPHTSLILYRQNGRRLPGLFV